MIIEKIDQIIEAILFTAGEPVSIERLQQLLSEQLADSTLENKLPAKELRVFLQKIAQCYHDRGIELVEVASGFRFQARSEFTPWLQRLHARKSARYSRAFLETLALIIYRQPLTRGEIEEIRGVAVSTQIIKSLLELEWIRIVGQRDVPGKPNLYATTKKFLDDFNLQDLTQLPLLPEPKNLEQIGEQLAEQLELEVMNIRD
jgi:segregation and condensation protein B